MKPASKNDVWMAASFVATVIWLSQKNWLMAAICSAFFLLYWVNEWRQK